MLHSHEEVAPARLGIVLLRELHRSHIVELVGDYLLILQHREHEVQQPNVAKPALVVLMAHLVDHDLQACCLGRDQTGVVALAD